MVTDEELLRAEKGVQLSCLLIDQVLKVFTVTKSVGVVDELLFELIVNARQHFSHAELDRVATQQALVPLARYVLQDCFRLCQLHVTVYQVRQVREVKTEVELLFEPRGF